MYGKLHCLSVTGVKVIISESISPKRYRTMKFKYPWWAIILHGFKKYKYVTGSADGKPVLIHDSRSNILYVSPAAHRILERKYKDEQDCI